MNLKLYDYVYNAGLGDCYVIAKNNDKYLFFVPNCGEHFVITDTIEKVDINDSVTFYYSQYAPDIETALKYLKEN